MVLRELKRRGIQRLAIRKVACLTSVTAATFSGVRVKISKPRKRKGEMLAEFRFIKEKELMSALKRRFQGLFRGWLDIVEGWNVAIVQSNPPKRNKGGVPSGLVASCLVDPRIRKCLLFRVRTSKRRNTSSLPRINVTLRHRPLDDGEQREC